MTDRRSLSVRRLAILAAALPSMLAIGCSDENGGGTGGAGPSSSSSSSSVSAGGNGASSGTAGGGAQGGAGAEGGGGGATVASHVYVESNDPAGNAILAFERGADGSLTGNSESYEAGGLGIPNPTQALGPDDSDQDLVFGPDKKRIFAVNSGSDTIAVFDVHDDGSLTPVAGSPFASGGKGPVSIGAAGDKIYVVNRGRDPGDVPNYLGFDVASDGALTPIAGSMVETSIGASPSQALVAPGGNLLFGADFMGPMATPPQGALRALTIAGDGKLATAPGSPLAIPEDATPAPPFALGLAVHPTEKVLYAGFVTYSQIGVYTYTDTGVLTLANQVANSGMAVCWIEPTADGKRFYTTNTASATVSWYDAATATAPVEMGALALAAAESGVPFVDAMGMDQTVTSAPFQLELSPDEDRLYVVSQRVTTNATDTSGNLLHELHVAADGSLTEPGAPLDLPVPPEARPQGVIVR